jgi:hypothetical protein
MFAVSPLTASTLYTHSFTDLHDITTVQGAPTLTPNVPAPGGKGGIALKFDDAPGSDGAARLDTGVMASATNATATFRIYIANQSNFMATYTDPPGEGIRYLDGGGLQESHFSTSLPGTWAFNTWYTVGFYMNFSGNTTVSMYFKQGANAQLTAADLIGGPVTGFTSPATIRAAFFNYGGQYLLADYTLNSGFDLTTVSTVPEPTSALLLALGALFPRRRG